MKNSIPIFRAKNLKGEWIEGDLIHNRGDVFIAPVGIANPLAEAEDFQVNESIVGQYIYLTDKNGNKAFVGDRFIDERGIELTIMLSDGGFVCEANPISFGIGESPYEALSDKQNSSWFSGTCEIIGNIYDK